jgi:peptidylprolyl isomerase
VAARRWIAGLGAALGCAGALAAQAPAVTGRPPAAGSVRALAAHPAWTPSAVLAQAPASAWRALDPHATLYMNLPDGRVVIELAPLFAPRYIANIKKLVREGFFNGAPIYRLQDNFVAEWGDPTGHKPVGDARRTVAAEFERPARGLPFTALPDRDTYAPQVGFSAGFPAARDPVFRRAWLVNCYGMVGAGRGLNVDSGGGTKLYAVIGGELRDLDRNTTLVGRVVEGMSLLSSLPRGRGKQGYYRSRRHRVRIRSMQVASDLPPSRRAALEVLRTDTPTFTRYLAALRNRRNPWFKVPAGALGVCAVPLPARGPGPAHTLHGWSE